MREIVIHPLGLPIPWYRFESLPRRKPLRCAAPLAARGQQLRRVRSAGNSHGQRVRNTRRSVLQTDYALSASQAASTANFSSCDQGAPRGLPIFATNRLKADGLRRKSEEAVARS